MFSKKDKVYRWHTPEKYTDELLVEHYSNDIEKNYSDFRNFRFIPITCKAYVYFYYLENWDEHIALRSKEYQDLNIKLYNKNENLSNREREIIYDEFLDELNHEEIFSDKYLVELFNFNDSNIPPASQLRNSLYQLYEKGNKGNFNYLKYLTPGFDSNLAFVCIEYILPTNQKLTIRCNFPKLATVLPHEYNVKGNQWSFPIVDRFTYAIPYSQINLKIIDEFSVLKKLYDEIFRSVSTNLPKYPTKFINTYNTLNSFIPNEGNNFPNLPNISFFNRNDFKLLEICSL